MQAQLESAQQSAANAQRFAAEIQQQVGDAQRQAADAQQRLAEAEARLLELDPKSKKASKAPAPPPPAPVVNVSEELDACLAILQDAVNDVPLLGSDGARETSGPPSFISLSSAAFGRSTLGGSLREKLPCARWSAQSHQGCLFTG